MRKWRRHSVEYKRQAVERMKGCDSIHALARELGVERKLLYTWKYQFEGRPEPRYANLAETAEQLRESKLKLETQRLKEALGQKTLEIDFLKGALRRIKEGLQKSTVQPPAAAFRRGDIGRRPISRAIRRPRLTRVQWT